MGLLQKHQSLDSKNYEFKICPKLLIVIYERLLIGGANKNLNCGKNCSNLINKKVTILKIEIEINKMCLLTGSHLVPAILNKLIQQDQGSFLSS